MVPSLRSVPLTVCLDRVVLEGVGIGYDPAL